MNVQISINIALHEIVFSYKAVEHNLLHNRNWFANMLLIIKSVHMRKLQLKQVY